MSLKKILKSGLKKAKFLEEAKEASRCLDCILSPFYIARPRLWRVGMREIDKRVAFDLENEYVYIRIPKCANSTVCVNLDHYFPSRSKKRESTRYADIVKEKKFVSPRNISFEESFNLRSKVLFTFVRNPYTRILSAYLDKVKDKEYAKKYQKEIKNYSEKGLSFLSFCRWLKGGGFKKDPHWMPQSWFINVFGVDKLDHIGKVESLNSDIQKIFKEISNIGQKIDIKEAKFSDHKNHSTGASKKLKKYYDKECLSIVRQFYKKDFEVLGYSKNIEKTF
jgi:hypothetical protein